MGGRRRSRVAITKRQPGMGSHPLMRYDQQVGSISVGSSSPGDDFFYTLFDNSSMAGGKYLKIGKLTLQWWVDFNQANLVYLAVMKTKEGATTPSLDDEVQIVDARSEGRLVRGPWQISTQHPYASGTNVLHARKTIVLKDLLLDPNDDLLFVLTTRKTSSTGTNTVWTFARTFWKVVE